MKDTIIKGTGNSYTLKGPATVPATWEEARAQLIAGTFPVDFLLNAAGLSQQGMALDKAHLLSDTTATALGLTGDPSVNDALGKLKALLNSTDTTVAGKGNCMVYSGTYIGNGATTVSLTFPKLPLVIFITPSILGIAIVKEGGSLYYNITDALYSVIHISGSTITLERASTSYPNYHNQSGSVYSYVAFATAS